MLLDHVYDKNNSTMSLRARLHRIHEEAKAKGFQANCNGPICNPDKIFNELDTDSKVGTQNSEMFATLCFEGEF